MVGFLFIHRPGLYLHLYQHCSTSHHIARIKRHTNILSVSVFTAKIKKAHCFFILQKLHWTVVTKNRTLKFYDMFYKQHRQKITPKKTIISEMKKLLYKNQMSQLDVNIDRVFSNNPFYPLCLYDQTLIRIQRIPSFFCG